MIIAFPFPFAYNVVADEVKFSLNVHGACSVLWVLDENDGNLIVTSKASWALLWVPNLFEKST